MSKLNLYLIFSSKTLKLKGYKYHSYLRKIKNLKCGKITFGVINRGAHTIIFGAINSMGDGMTMKLFVL